MKSKEFYYELKKTIIGIHNQIKTCNILHSTNQLYLLTPFKILHY